MSTVRMSAEERRTAVVEAAAPLIARTGFEATPTLEIAKAAGISHAYLFRLFPSKEELAVAVVERCNRLIHERFAHAAEAARARGQDVATAMGGAYIALLEDRTTILGQLHAHAASPSHPQIREAMRASFRDLVGLVTRETGAPAEAVNAFFAQGMLLNVTVALDLEAVDEEWARVLTCTIADPAPAAPPPAEDAPGA
ncbi:TetR/AcrR family transcriptional regulator [Patulibacter sp. S7RM1-6]